MSVNMSASGISGNGYNSSLINTAVEESQHLLNATIKCQDLWDEMRKADFRKEGILNEMNIQLVYENKSKIIQDLLKISSAEDFVEVFDDDNDGFLNEDEQILVFTVIKERTQLIAEELCFVKKYEIYKDLMAEVRKIEGLINSFQNHLRQNLHSKQMQDYLSIGDEMNKEFQENWANKLYFSSEIGNKDLIDLKKRMESISQNKIQKESSKVSSIKVKPSNRIKLLENQERLVAINERIDEAANFRNEIKKAKKNDEIRLQNTKEWMIKNLKKKIEIEVKKEIKKKIDRNNLDEFNLLITKNKETDILSKQINLHINDIIRIQNSLTNYYLDKGI